MADWLEKERKKDRRCNLQQRHIFVMSQSQSQSTKKTSIMDGTTGWNLEVDIGEKLVFPDIVHINLRQDIILWSEIGKKLIMIELTVPWETRYEEAYEKKKPNYIELLIECRESSYRTWLFPIEVGAREFCSQTVSRLMAVIGTTSRDRRNTIQRLSQVAESVSSCLWLRRVVLEAIDLHTVRRWDLGKPVRDKSSIDAGQQEQWYHLYNLSTTGSRSTLSYESPNYVELHRTITKRLFVNPPMLNLK